MRNTDALRRERRCDDVKNEKATIVCVISGPTPEMLRAGEHLARTESALDRVSTVVSFSFPGGVERRVERSYRIGDYFDRIEIGNLMSEGRSFEMVFHVRPDAGRYWKDLIVGILRDMEQAGFETAINPSRPA